MLHGSNLDGVWDAAVSPSITNSSISCNMSIYTVTFHGPNLIAISVKMCLSETIECVSCNLQISVCHAITRRLVSKSIYAQHNRNGPPVIINQGLSTAKLRHGHALGAPTRFPLSHHLHVPMSTQCE